MDNLIKCPTCGHDVARSAQKCQNCGAATPSQVKVVWISLIVTAGLMLWVYFSI